MPIPVEGGLQARSQRGRIGETWWSGRFLAVLESLGLGSRLQRGKRYARTGQVISMQIAPGQVSASVQGSRAKPYRVFIETATLSGREWRSVTDTMSARASFVARLLAGEMPEDIEEAFAESSCSLFPASTDDIDAACSCPDWENPCKHIAAVYYLLAEAFDTDPWIIFTWRGREKDELLKELRARRRVGAGNGDDERVTGADRDEDERQRRATASHLRGPDVDEGADADAHAASTGLGWPAPAEAGEVLAARSSRANVRGDHGADIWRAPVDLSDLEVRPRLVVAPDLVLRQLDPAPLGRDAEKILERLRPMYEVFVASAMRALDEEAPST